MKIIIFQLIFQKLHRQNPFSSQTWEDEYKYIFESITLMIQAQA